VARVKELEHDEKVSYRLLQLTRSAWQRAASIVCVRGTSAGVVRLVAVRYGLQASLHSLINWSKAPSLSLEREQRRTSFLHLFQKLASLVPGPGDRGARWNGYLPEIAGENLLSTETVDDVLLGRTLLAKGVTSIQYII
jgi:hypothetical protein